MRNFFSLMLCLLFIIVAVIYGVAEVYKYQEDEKDIGNESINNPKANLVKAKAWKGFMIIFGVIVLFVLVAQWILGAHDRRVEIETTKTWPRVKATILDVQSESQYKSGSKGGTTYHCFHIRVGYDFNQIHYTSEIEFLDKCKANSLPNLDFTAIARHYYPPNYTLQVFVDPNNPQHIRDMSYITKHNDFY